MEQQPMLHGDDDKRQASLNKFFSDEALLPLFFKLLSAIVGFSITSPAGEICKKLLLVDNWCD